MKKLLSLLLVLTTLVGMLSVSAVPASAATSYSVSVKTGTYYTIKNVGSGKMLNVYGNRSANNTNITVYSADGTTGQLFKFTKVGSSYTITPKCATNKVLNVYGSASKQNSNVCLWSKTGHSTQGWVVEYNPSKDGFIIRSANNKNYVLAATGSKNSSNVCLKKYNANDNYQVWRCNGLTVKQNTSTTTVTKSKIKTSQIQAVLDKYGYKDGKYWTIKEKRNGNNCSANAYNKDANLYATNYAATTNGAYKSYNYENQWQCHGFASYVMAKVTNTKIRPTYNVGDGWKKISGENNIKELLVGDIIRTTGHTAVVLSVNDDGTCTFAEVWGSEGCQINIGKFNNSCSTLAKIKSSYNVEYVFRYVG